MYSLPIEQLIKAFMKLPGVGRRTAERYVFHLLKSGKKDAGEVALALKNMIQSVKSCDICWNFSDTSPCEMCTDPKRDHSIICVVAEPQDLRAIERTGDFHGQYHILRGVLDTEQEHSIRRIKAKELMERLKSGKVKEVIFALNPDIKGETTMMFLRQHINKTVPDITLTRLARGLPMGSDLEYADEITLGSALKNRTS